MFDYGCWITHDGQIAEVDWACHAMYLDSYFGYDTVDEFESLDGDTMAIAWAHGWIRIVWESNKTGMAVEFQSISPKACATCKRIMRDFYKENRLFGTFYINSRVVKRLATVNELLDEAVDSCYENQSISS